jgi:hypothetical protein
MASVRKARRNLKMKVKMEEKSTHSLHRFVQQLKADIIELKTWKRLDRQILHTYWV